MDGAINIGRKTAFAEDKMLFATSEKSLQRNLRIWKNVLERTSETWTETYSLSIICLCE